MRKVKLFIKQFYYKYLRRDLPKASFYRWKFDNGDSILRYNYSLNKNSIVVDAGGFHGDFAFEIHERFGSTVIIFEPIPQYFELIKNRFQNVGNIEVISSGLSDRARICEMTVSGSSSSQYNAVDQKETTLRVDMLTLDTFLSERDIQCVDLLKLNIEGGEYDVLDSLIKSGWIKKINNIQVQFHSFVENAKRRRKQIQNNLLETHIKTWDYPFVWENWTLRNLP